jgi:hypothetical protein
LPPSAAALDIVLGMTVQRVVFHYGIELEGLKYNGPELGELRRRIGPVVKVELTFDPGDLGHIHVFDRQKATYVRVPAVDQSYASGLTLWQHRVIRRYAQCRLKARTDHVALAQAKAEIRALVERDFNRKSRRGRKRQARFMGDHTQATLAKPVMNPPALATQSGAGVAGVPGPQRQLTGGELNQFRAPEIPLTSDPMTSRIEAFTDDESLPVFEAALDLPRSPTAAAPTKGVPIMEKGNG